MTAIAVGQNADEIQLRQAHLMRLRYELARQGVWARVRKSHNGRWKLRLRSGSGAPLTAVCGGAEGVYAFMTGDGRLLGPVADVRYIARTLVWMLEENYR